MNSTRIAVLQRVVSEKCGFDENGGSNSSYVQAKNCEEIFSNFKANVTLEMSKKSTEISLKTKEIQELKQQMQRKNREFSENETKICNQLLAQQTNVVLALVEKKSAEIVDLSVKLALSESQIMLKLKEIERISDELQRKSEEIISKDEKIRKMQEKIQMFGDAA